MVLRLAVSIPTNQKTDEAVQDTKSGRKWQSQNEWPKAGKFPFEGELLKDAITRTFARRERPLPAAVPVALTPEFAASVNLAREVTEKVASIHAGLATILAAETPAKRGQRRKLWE